MVVREETASGLDYLGLATRLLQRVRTTDQTGGFWEAADVQWWWRMARASDDIEQLFWVDDDGPVGAAILIDWRGTWSCEIVVVPSARPELLPSIWSHATERIESLEIEDVFVLARDDDPELLRLLTTSGFVPGDEAGGATWMDAADCPSVPSLPDGFTLRDRGTARDHMHHLSKRNGPDVERRLNQTSLYDADLDLSIVSPEGETAAYGLFWFDPITKVGLVEPMRTEDDYQRLGLARAVLLEGVRRLVEKGAKRIKVGYASEAARSLYTGAGFQIESTDRQYVRARRA